MSTEIWVVAPDAPGESTVDHLVDIRGHTVTTVPFQALTLQVGETTPVTLGGSSGGQSVGRPTLTPVTLTKAVDKASVPLFRTALKGVPLSTVQVIIARPGAQRQVFQQYDLGGVYVESVVQTVQSVTAAPGELLTLVASTLRLSYAPFNPDGTRGTVQSVFFDQLKGTIS